MKQVKKIIWKPSNSLSFVIAGKTLENRTYGVKLIKQGANKLALYI